MLPGGSAHKNRYRVLCIHNLEDSRETKNIQYFDKYKVLDARRLLLLPAQLHTDNFQDTYSKVLNTSEEKSLPI